ncbi:MAG: hypothetical protein ACREPG_05360, partial [Candidatus Binatia bacterium]
VTETFPPFVVSQTLPVSLTRQEQLLTFQFSSPLPFPSTPGQFGAVAHYYAALIYRGALGVESESVVASSMCGFSFYHGFDVPPPFGTGEPIIWLGPDGEC